jgi:hypothetical protein
MKLSHFSIPFGWSNLHKLAFVINVDALMFILFFRFLIFDLLSSRPFLRVGDYLD